MANTVESPASTRSQARQATGAPARTTRNAALDFTKGALVLFMVVYHWLNYFVGLNWPYYRYFRFLTPSFVFISGFMISTAYLSKYEASDPRLTKRLLGRGFKLIAIFIVLNVARLWLLPLLSNRAVAPDLLDGAALLATFVTGNFTGKLVAFSILIPIAYLLILSALLMLRFKAYNHIFRIAWVCLLGIIVALERTGEKNPYVEIVAIGMLGVLAGLRPISSINRAIRHPYLLGVAYLLYTVAITKWNVPYPLEVVGTCLTVIIVYLAGTVGDRPNWIRDEVILLGKYSLWAYISQIVILQFLQAGFRHLNLGSAGLTVSFAAAMTLTVFGVEMVHRGRSRAGGIDTLYRAVFG